ncbi:nucleolar protein 12 [Pyxicephalus adspersus]|uniref:nucleolar protein 12 n=1 Tax=Pyxicephalus adspersus TaxID=30357 RepID=UPI003B58D9B7
MGKRKNRKVSSSRRELVFDEEKRREYLTGFHKRKLQRRKAAVEEIKQKIKVEQKKMKEEFFPESGIGKKKSNVFFFLEEIDEVERLVTAKTESVLYDHPSHTVTVTTISDLDLSGVGLLPPGIIEKDENQEESAAKFTAPLPKKAGDPLLSKRICSLTKTLHARSRSKSQKRPPRTMDGKKQPIRPTGRTSKAQRRRQTGKTGRNRE